MTDRLVSMATRLTRLFSEKKVRRTSEVFDGRASEPFKMSACLIIVFVVVKKPI